MESNLFEAYPRPLGLLHGFCFSLCMLVHSAANLYIYMQLARDLCMPLYLSDNGLWSTSSLLVAPSWWLTDIISWWPQRIYIPYFLVQLEWERSWCLSYASHTLKVCWLKQDNWIIVSLFHLWKWHTRAICFLFYRMYPSFWVFICLHTDTQEHLVYPIMSYYVMHPPVFPFSCLLSISVAILLACRFLPLSCWSLSKMYSNFLPSVTLHIYKNTISDSASAFSLTWIQQSSILNCPSSCAVTLNDGL